MPATGNPAAAAPVAPLRDAVAEEPKPLPIPPALAVRAGMRPLVIAIDPGHGGQDPGAIGPSGKQEKDVTLAIGRELARQINATPGLKAYMTRDTDVFIPLPMRAKLARAPRRTCSSRSTQIRPRTAAPPARRYSCCPPRARPRSARAGWPTRKTRPIWSAACACRRPTTRWLRC
jgi:hypothetical protein